MEARNLWITIGPQCCGKTTFLQDHGVLDVSMDAMPHTYYPFSVEKILKYLQEDLSEEQLTEYENKIHGLSISERIENLGNNECLALILYFSESISIDHLAFKLKFECHLEDNIVEYIIDVVSSLFSGNYRLITPTIDFFLVERRFESINAAQSMLWSMSNGNCDIAWGNTNLIAKFYQVALDVAYESRRRVRFIKWGYELPAVDLSELYRRNIIRFLSTGRFIPFAILQRYYNDANELLMHWNNLLESSGSEISLDDLLIREAGYSREKHGFLT